MSERPLAVFGSSWSHADLDRLIELTAQGLSTSHCAKIFGFTVQRVQDQKRRLRRLGAMPMSPRRHAPRKALALLLPEYKPLPARRCLVHGGPFTPKNRHDFVCDSCEATEAWRCGT